MATSYANPGGSGNRVGYIPGITTNASFGGTGGVVALIDGSYAGAIWFSNGQTARWIAFNFGGPCTIDEVTWRQSNATNNGTWQWQESSDGVSWADLGAPFLLGSAAVHVVSVPGGSLQHRRLNQVSGTTTNSPNLIEIEFKISEIASTEYIRTTQAGLEILAPEGIPTAIRTTQTALEILTSADTAVPVRATQVALEILVPGPLVPINQRPEAPTLAHAALTAESVTITRIPGTDPEGDPIVGARLQVARDAAFSAVVYDSGEPGEAPFTEKALTGLAPLTLYYYRGQDADEGGMGAWSAPQSFATPNISRPATPVVQVDERSKTGSACIFTESAYAHPDGRAHQATRIRVLRKSDLIELFTTGTIPPAFEARATGLPVDGTALLARIAHQDEDGAWGLDGEHEFRIQGVPRTPTITTPAGGATYDEEIACAWQGTEPLIDLTTRYRLYHDAGDGAWTPIISEEGTDQTSYLWYIRPLADATGQRLRVVAFNELGEATATSGAWNIEHPRPTTVTITDPEPGQRIDGAYTAHWTPAFDSQGRPLTYRGRRSADLGRTWTETFAGITATEGPVCTAPLPSGIDYLFQVRAEASPDPEDQSGWATVDFRVATLTHRWASFRGLDVSRWPRRHNAGADWGVDETSGLLVQRGNVGPGQPLSWKPSILVAPAAPRANQVDVTASVQIGELALNPSLFDQAFESWITANTAAGVGALVKGAIAETNETAAQGVYALLTYGPITSWGRGCSPNRGWETWTSLWTVGRIGEWSETWSIPVERVRARIRGCAEPSYRVRLRITRPDPDDPTTLRFRASVYGPGIPMRSGYWLLDETVTHPDFAGYTCGESGCASGHLGTNNEPRSSRWFEHLTVSTIENGDCAPPTTRGLRLEMLEAWSDVVAAGGQRLAFTRDCTGATYRRTLEGEERARFALPRDSAFWAHVADRRVIRAVYTDCTWEEFRVARTEGTRTPDGALEGVLDCETIRYDLASGVTERVEMNGSVEHHFELYGLLPAEHLEVILGAARPYIVPGLVQAEAALDLRYHGSTPLEQLLELAAATETELEVERDEEDRYVVSLLTERGASSERPLIAHRRNASQMQRSTDSSRLVNRVIPLGAEEDGRRHTIAAAQWEVAFVDVEGARVQLAGGPIAFDAQFDGCALELMGAAGCRAITATDYLTQTLTLASLAEDEVAVGDLVWIRRDTAGTELTYLDAPASIERWGGPARLPWTAPLDISDVPPIDNLLLNAFLSDWETRGGTLLPADWSVIGAPEVKKNTESLYRRFGDASAHVIAAAAGEGLESEWLPVRPSKASPYGTVQAAVFVRSGRVRLEWDVVDADNVVTTLPPAGVVANTSTVLNQWTEADKALAIGGINLGGEGDDALNAVAFSVRVLSDAPETEFFLDAVQVTLSQAGYEDYYPGLGSNDLWLAANRHLREFAEPRYSYETDAVDLYRLWPTEYPHDRLAEGRTVRVIDEDLGVDVETRVSEVEYDLLEEGVTRVALASRRPDVTQVVIARPLARSRRPVRPPPPVVPPPVVPPGGDAPGLGSIANSGLRENVYENADRHLLEWAHSESVQTGAGEEGAYTLTVRRTIAGVTTAVVEGRDPRVDISTATGFDLGDTVPLRGGVGIEAFRAASSVPGTPVPPLATQVTMTYTLELWEGAKLLKSYPAAQYAGWYYLDGALERVALAERRSEYDGERWIAFEPSWNHTRVMQDAAPGVWTIEIEEFHNGESRGVVVTVDPRDRVAGARELCGSWRVDYREHPDLHRLPEGEWEGYTWVRMRFALHLKKDGVLQATYQTAESPSRLLLVPT